MSERIGIFNTSCPPPDVILQVLNQCFPIKELSKHGQRIGRATPYDINTNREADCKNGAIVTFGQAIVDVDLSVIGCLSVGGCVHLPIVNAFDGVAERRGDLHLDMIKVSQILKSVQAEDICRRGIGDAYDVCAVSRRSSTGEELIAVYVKLQKGRRVDPVPEKALKSLSGRIVSVWVVVAGC